MSGQNEVYEADQAQATAADQRPYCDHRCLMDEGHVERGELHFYGYTIPSDRSVIERLTSENERLRDAGAELLNAFDWALRLVGSLPLELRYEFDQAMGRARNGWTFASHEGAADDHLGVPERAAHHRPRQQTDGQLPERLMAVDDPEDPELDVLLGVPFCPEPEQEPGEEEPDDESSRQRDS